MAADKEGYQVAAVHKLIEELGRQGDLKAAESDGDRRAIEAAISYMSDEEAGVGFLYSGWCQAALPHKKLADEAVWKVQTERVTLVVEPGRRNLLGDHTEFVGVPYGSRARLIRRAPLDVLIAGATRGRQTSVTQLRKLLRKQGRAPRVLLRSYAAAKQELCPASNTQHKGLKNRAENSHQPTRRRERIMKGFRSPRQVQRFRSTPGRIANVFSRRPNQDTAAKFRTARNQAIITWAEVTRVTMAA